MRGGLKKTLKHFLADKNYDIYFYSANKDVNIIRFRKNSERISFTFNEFNKMDGMSSIVFLWNKYSIHDENVLLTNSMTQGFKISLHPKKHE